MSRLVATVVALAFVHGAVAVPVAHADDERGIQREPETASRRADPGIGAPDFGNDLAWIAWTTIGTSALLTGINGYHAVEGSRSWMVVRVLGVGASVADFVLAGAAWEDYKLISVGLGSLAVAGLTGAIFAGGRGEPEEPDIIFTMTGDGDALVGIAGRF